VHGQDQIRSRQLLENVLLHLPRLRRVFDVLLASDHFDGPLGCPVNRAETQGQVNDISFLDELNKDELYTFSRVQYPKEITNQTYSISILPTPSIVCTRFTTKIISGSIGGQGQRLS